MRVKAIMIPFEKIACINVDDSLKMAMEVIDEHALLSLPVVQGKTFIGVLSKQFTYESFFKNFEGSREEFLEKPVSDLMVSKIETIRDDVRIEEAAAKFISSKVRFIPITDTRGDLQGIVTQQAVFKQYQKMFGKEHNSLVIYTYDYKGVIAKITETIAKANGDICNIMVQDTEVMDLTEVFVRVACEDFGKVVKALKKQSFDVRDIVYAK